MDLKKFLPGSNNNESTEFYWSLIIEPGWVQAGIWKIVGNAAEVVYSSKPVVWEMESELVNASDTVLSSAIQNFPEDFVEPTKTVFGVAYGWMKDGEIAPEYLDSIKKICTELSLTPVGFVVMAEAITHLIKSETGTPINSIVLGVYKQNLELSLFDKGKLTGTTQIARSVSLVEDVVEGLSRLKTEGVLPSKIMVYDGREGDLEDARQELLQVDWDTYNNLKFLHSPKVEIINSDRKVFAVSLAGASELAGITTLVAKTIPEVEVVEEPVLKEIDSKHVIPVLTEAVVSPEDLGFVVEKVDDKNVSSQNFGDEESLTSEEDLGLIETNISPATEEEAGIDNEPKQGRHVKNNVLGNFSKTLSSFGSKIPKINVSLPNLGGGLRPFFWGGGFLLGVIILAGLFWWFVPKASVTIYLSPKKLEEAIDLTVDSSINVPDNVSKKVPGKLTEISVSGEKTTDTTGTKTVGDKASGEVTVYRVGPQITLASGTLLNGPQNLKFAIDSSVSIASGSASTPGETKIAVKAANIGAEYNLASGTTFSVGNYSSSDMEAKNSASFSGGSSREIQAVSKDDIAKLESELTEELLEKAGSDILANLNEDEFLIKESIENKDITADFSHKVGDEAGSVGLNLNLKVSGIVVSKKDLSGVSEEVLKTKVSSGFVLSSDQITYSFGDVKKDNGAYNFNVKIVANLLPDVRDDEVKSKIKGRQIQIAKDYLQTSIPAFTRVEIKIKPSFPGKLKTLPHVEKNIEVQFAADR